MKLEAREWADEWSRHLLVPRGLRLDRSKHSLRDLSRDPAAAVVRSTWEPERSMPSFSRLRSCAPKRHNLAHDEVVLTDTDGMDQCKVVQNVLLLRSESQIFIKFIKSKLHSK